MTRGKKGTSRFALPASARPGGKPGGGRPVQVGAAVREEIGLMLTNGSLKDPRLAQMITVTDVEMTQDLRLARVFFSVFPDDAQILKDVLRGFASASGQIRREVARRLQLRFAPELEFAVDSSIAEGAKIEGILREIHEAEAVDQLEGEATSRRVAAQVEDQDGLHAASAGEREDGGAGST